MYNTLVRILVATFKLEKNCSLLWKCMKVGMTENCVGTARGWDALLSSCSSCCDPFGGKGHFYFGTSRSCEQLRFDEIKSASKFVNNFNLLKGQLISKAKFSFAPTNQQKYFCISDGCDAFGPERIWSPDIRSPTSGPQTFGPTGQMVPPTSGPLGQMVP